MTILPITPPGPPPSPARHARASGTGFALPARSNAAAGAAPPAPMPLDWALSLQEVDPPSERDRRARKHASRTLDLLGRLQHSLLQDECPSQVLAELAELGCNPPIAADAGLQALLATISVRAHVELARRIDADVTPNTIAPQIPLARR